MKKLLLSIALVASCLTVLLAQPCLPEGIFFETQAQIDSFQINFPGCTEIEGDVKIGSYGPSGTDISNLDSLYVLTTIGGDLTINGNDITNLSGLENLISVDESLTIHSNQYLADLTGLSGLENIGGDFDIHNCIALISLMGMENLINIGGNLTIGDFDYGNPLLTDLQGLEGISTIQGNIIIHNNNNLSCLLGLDNIVSVGNHVSITNNGDLTDLTSLSNLTSIGGSLSILHNSMNNLSGLEGVDSIPGVLWIGGNINLTNLSGLENLTYTGGLAIGNNSVFMGCGNPLLTDLVALENLAMVEGNIEISTNISLNSLNGLGSIAAGSIENIKIDNNSQLTQCNVQSICEYLVSPNGFVEIYDNGTGCNSQQEVEEACESTCLPEGITFTTQAQIDSFQINYPNCTEIEGDVTILGDSITNLIGLNCLTGIIGSLYIGNGAILAGNPLLHTLSGLDNITSIGGCLSIDYNYSLNNITALANLNYVGESLSIYKNIELESLTGLEGISSLGGSLGIQWNSDLSSLVGLNSINSIGGDLHINVNSNIISLTGLENLASLTGALYVTSNNILPSLIGVENIDASTISKIFIADNPYLSYCEVQSVCDYIMLPNADIFINDNAFGCNSQQEVEEACLTDVPKLRFDGSFTISPNPCSGSTNLRFTIAEQGLTICDLFEISGIKVKFIMNEEKTPGTYEMDIKLNDLPKGVYFCILKTNEGIQTRKIIKL